VNAIDESTGNVYEDLGHIEANEMRAKASLAAKISEIINTRHLTQIQASEILGLSQPQLNDILLGRFRDISEMKMMDWLSRLECNGS
jgi:predicted XRE-type DNA-binding protein